MPRKCAACQESNAHIYCKADSAYLCFTCDSKVHGANKLASRHERVWMCEVCEHAPAAVTCKADAAVLCVSCDSDIHSANPLARRHERTPVTPFFDPSPPMKISQCNLLHKLKREDQLEDEDDEDESSAAEAASWLLPDPRHFDSNDDELSDVAADQDEEDEYRHEESLREQHQKQQEEEQQQEQLQQQQQQQLQQQHQQQQAYQLENSGSFYRGVFKSSSIKNLDLFPDVDPYLDLDFVSAMGAVLQSETDSLVPIASASPSSVPSSNNSPGNSYDCSLQLKASSHHHHDYCATELSNSQMSSSSIDVGVVPDSSLSDISTPTSYHHPMLYDFQQQQQQQQLQQQQQQQQQQQMLRPPTLHHATPLEPLAREARVLRYREKRKNRKFEKTIRYASRKAYAETRPRIKGRFAKRTEIGEQMYAVVPSF